MGRDLNLDIPTCPEIDMVTFRHLENQFFYEGGDIFI